MKIKNTAVVVAAALFVAVFSLWSILKPAAAQSEAERRPLAQMPEISAIRRFYGGF